MNIQDLCPHCMRRLKNNQVRFCPMCGTDRTKKAVVKHQLAPFSVLKDKYVVGEVIGQGGFGITYIGLDTTLEVRVAIKELYPDEFCTRTVSGSSNVELYKERDREIVLKLQKDFLSEARRLGKCCGLPGVVGVREYFEENNTAYIIMEYLDGMNLEVYTKRQGGKLPARILLPAIKPVMATLVKVHEQGLIHRDISPDNILCLPSGELKLIDFGAARDCDAVDEKSRLLALKYGYAPEEQCHRKGIQGPWTDVYSLAATIYKCLTGVTPPQSVDRMYEDDLKRPNALGAGLTPPEETALMRAMAVYAKDRFRTMEEFYNALYGTGEIPAPATAPGPVAATGQGPAGGQTAASTQRGRGLLFVAIGIVLCVAVGTGGFVLFKSLSERNGKPAAAAVETEEAANLEPESVTPKEAPMESADNEAPPADSQVDEARTGGLEYQELENGNLAVTGYSGTGEELTIPEKIDGKTVEILRKLETDTVKQLTIPGSVIAIEEDAIVSGSIEKIILRDGIQRINDGSFQECTRLEELTIPKSIDYIGMGVFPVEFVEKQKEIRGIYYLDNFALAIKEDESEFRWNDHTIGICGDFWKLFHGSQELELESLEIPEGVVFIGKGAFRCVHAKEIHVPESVHTIGKYALGCDPDKQPYSDVVIFGPPGSEAGEYAEKNNISYVSVD